MSADTPIEERIDAYRRLFDLSGKTALVLGAASGIGKASAEALAALGAAVICADKAEAHGVLLPAIAPKTDSALREVVPDFGSVGNPSDLTAEVLKTSETFGFCLDAFLNDPGFSYGHSGWDPTAGWNATVIAKHPRPGFVSAYAMHNEYEDEAETYAFMFVKEEHRELVDFITTDPILKGKVEHLKQRIGAIDPAINDSYLERAAQ